jgi:VanZ family protein
MPGVGRVASSWLPPLAWMAIIFAFSSMHGSGHLPEAEVLLRKLAHVAGYLVLTLLFLRALRRSGVVAAVPIAMAGALAYAVSDEWHQSFVPGRGATPRDVAIDGIGIGLAALAGTRTRLRALAA